MALLDTQVGVLANQAMSYLVSGNVPKRMGNAHPHIVPYQVFRWRTGHVIMAVGNDAQFATLHGDPRRAGACGRPSLSDECGPGRRTAPR